MDRSEVKAIVDREIETYKKAFGLQHWDIRIVYERLSEEVAGRCFYDINYFHATIKFDAHQIDDELALLKFLRHELFHLVLAPVHLAERVLEDLTKEGSRLRSVTDTAARQAVEQMVFNLERMFNGICEMRVERKDYSRPTEPETETPVSAKSKSQKPTAPPSEPSPKPRPPKPKPKPPERPGKA